MTTTPKSCATCALLKPHDHPDFKHICTWRMTEAAPSWLLASWRPTDRNAVRYPDEHGSERLRTDSMLAPSVWKDGTIFPPIGHDCAAHKPA